MNFLSYPRSLGMYGRYATFLLDTVLGSLKKQKSSPMQKKRQFNKNYLPYYRTVGTYSYLPYIQFTLNLSLRQIFVLFGLFFHANVLHLLRRVCPAPGCRKCQPIVRRCRGYSGLPPRVCTPASASGFCGFYFADLFLSPNF